MELRPAEMDALRVYVGAAERLRVPPAEGLLERVRTATFDGPANRWSLCLTEKQMESVAYAFYLRALCGSVAEAIRFAREYGVVVHGDRSTGSLQPARLYWPDGLLLSEVCAGGDIRPSLVG
ncbi:DUF6417 family protein [Streptomyces camelliae]|uniref:DUF6417 family protein n=1 Tax=Streptomyces camelliae TaxID=3004093 RepID=UPI002FD83A3B